MNSLSLVQAGPGPCTSTVILLHYYDLDIIFQSCILSPTIIHRLLLPSIVKPSDLPANFFSFFYTSAIVYISRYSIIRLTNKQCGADRLTIISISLAQTPPKPPVPDLLHHTFDCHSLPPLSTLYEASDYDARPPFHHYLLPISLVCIGTPAITAIQIPQLNIDALLALYNHASEINVLTPPIRGHTLIPLSQSHFPWTLGLLRFGSREQVQRIKLPVQSPLN